MASNLVDKQWLCFRAKQPTDELTYATIQVDLPSPPATNPVDPPSSPPATIPTIEEDGRPTSPDVDATEEPPTTVRTEEEEPDYDFNFVQSGDTVSATNDDLTDPQFFVSDSEPECSASNTSSTYISNASASNLKDKQWVCFKAKDSQGVTRYAKMQVSLPPAAAAPVSSSTEEEEPAKPNSSNDFLWWLILVIVMTVVGGGLFVKSRRRKLSKARY